MPWTQPVLWRVKRPTATSSFGTQTRLLFSLFFSWCFFGALASWAQPCPGPPFPARLVSLSPLLTENIFVLGAGDRLVGNTVYCQRPTAAQDKEKIGSVQELSIEKIVSLKPDLILASNLTSRQQIDKLRTIGLRVETFGQPASFADICAHFRRLGVMLGLEAQAESIIAQAQAKVEAVRDAVAQDFIELGGGINIAGEQRLGAMKTEQVIALNPEVILIAVMGSEDGIGAEEKNRWLRFPTINAAQNGQVYLLDPDLVCSPSPLTFAETLLTVARLIHPEVANRRPPSLAAP
jgi:iron complex transport system substrate-binding protein